MRILAIGDFHGSFPKKFEKIIAKEKIDLIVSVGDFMPFSYRKEWFKHCYGKETELWEIIGKKKYKDYILKDLKQGEAVLKKLNKIGETIPIVTVTGNLDYTKWEDAIDSSPMKWKWLEQDFFTKIIKKYQNIKVLDYSSIKINDWVFIGMARSTFPGQVKSKNYKKLRKKLDRLFKKYKNKNIIFVSHNVPYNTKLDLIHSKEAHKRVKDKHYGSKLVRRIIESYKPSLSIAGHVHENQGKDKIGKTVCINTGAINDGRGAIITIDDKTKKLKTAKFIK